MPPTGSFGGWFGFSPFNGLFSSLSVIFANYRHTLKPGDPGLRRSVPTSYIGPVRGVRASYGVVWGLVWVFTHLTACFHV